MRVPLAVPLPGYYYHYKHDPSGPLNNYAYAFINVGCHTEEDCRPEDAAMVVYRPLYEEAFVYKNGKLFDLRPLLMWMGDVVRSGVTMKRFTHIKDPVIIEVLRSQEKAMYG